MVDGGLMGAGSGLMPSSVPQDSGRNDQLRKMVAADPSLIILNYSDAPETPGGGMDGEQADASSSGGDGSVDEQTRKAQDFDKVQGRLPLGQKADSQGASQQARADGAGRPPRGDADMQARVEAYQQDFDRTIDEKIAAIDEEVADIDRRLEGDRFGKSRAVTRPAGEARKEALLEERANLEKLDKSSDADRQAEFEDYQRHFDQKVNDKIADVDQDIADVDRQIDGASRFEKPNLLLKKQELTEQRADLQKIADTPDAALETLKARHDRESGNWTASDVGHLALDVLGVVPGIGNLADGMNVAWYTAEGRHGDALVAMGSAAVGAGIGVTLAKWFGKGADAAKIADNGVDAPRGGPDGPDAPSGKAETSEVGKADAADTSRVQVSDIGELRPPARQVLDGEDVLISHSQGLQSRTSGLFEGVVQGTHGDAATKYLYTIDDRGVNIALEKTPAATPRGNIVHTNLSDRAVIGGEAWFGPDNTVTINAGSGRFGDGAGITQQQWDNAARYWEGLGYTVNQIPYGSR